MNKSLLSKVFIALLPATLAVPLSASAEGNCVGSDCVVTFQYSGNQQEFSFPAGATNVSFEIYGASGGRGSAGGKVTGTLTQVPQTLYIVVGGAGKTGEGAAGGFNGGGGAGGNSGSEGSGGGASDIRLSAGLESRIIVAGGGGGGGGAAGGAGGQGGNVFGGNGVSGQGSGGGGGTPDRGGTAGASNGGFSSATAGSFGIGGRGGYGSFAGGGGGGGGWYGGGGGGADDNTCCSDGGGGGGGSSYASIQYTSNVVHQAGSNWGDGRVVISYTRPPSVSTFSLSQVSSGILRLNMEASETIVGLIPEDFVIDGADCELASLEVSEQLAVAEITGCKSGEVAVVLQSLSFGLGALGPAEPSFASLFFDASGPEFLFESEPILSSLENQVIQFSVSDNIALTASNFEVSGCEIAQVTATELWLEACGSGQVEIVLRAGTLFDQWQNPGPVQDARLAFTVDLDAPEAYWLPIEITGENPFVYRTTLQFSEPVNVDLIGLEFESDSDCSTSTLVFESAIEVESLCSYANLSWSFTPGAIDIAGNPMSAKPIILTVSNLEPALASPIEPAPVPEPQPQESPLELIQEQPSAPLPATGNLEDETEGATEPVTPLAPEPIVESLPEADLPSQPQSTPDQGESITTALEVSGESEIAPNPESSAGAIELGSDAVSTEQSVESTGALGQVIAEPALVASIADETEQPMALPSPLLLLALLLLAGVTVAVAMRFSGR